METLQGTVERVTYFNEENGYSVIKIKADKRYPTAEARDGLITVVGSMPEIGVGENVQFGGDWVDDVEAIGGCRWNVVIDRRNSAIGTPDFATAEAEAFEGLWRCDLVNEVEIYI